MWCSRKRLSLRGQPVEADVIEYARGEVLRVADELRMTRAPAAIRRRRNTNTTISIKAPWKRRGMEVGENQIQVSPVPHTRLEISQTAQDSHFPPRRLRLLFSPGKQKPNPIPKRRRPDSRITVYGKPDTSRVNRSGHLELVKTVKVLSSGDALASLEQ